MGAWAGNSFPAADLSQGILFRPAPGRSPMFEDPVSQDTGTYQFHIPCMIPFRAGWTDNSFRSDQPSCLTGSTGKFFRQHFCCLSFCSACDQIHEQGFFHFLGNCPGISPDSLGVIHARPLTFQYLVNLLLVDIGK